MSSQSFQKFMQLMEGEREDLQKRCETLEGVRTSLKFFEGRYPVPDDVTVDSVDAGGVPAEWVSAPSARDDRIMLYIHGGCYISGSPRTVRECCARLSAASACKILSVDYRIAPENPYPAALDDVMNAYEWLLTSGHDAKNIVIAGESAGGGLTFATLMRIRDEGRLPMPALGVPISPWIDMTLQHESLKRNLGRDIATVEPLAMGAQLYVGDSDPKGPYVSPLFGELGALPPLLFQVGGGEVLLDDSIAIVHKAREAGVDVTFEVWPDMVHIWHWYAGHIEEGAEAIQAIGTYVNERMG